MKKSQIKSKIALLASAVLLFVFMLPITASAASHPILTQSVDLRTKVTITTEGNESVLTNSKGQKYTLDDTSVLYSGGGVLKVYLNNTAPATIDSIITKGLFQVMGGTGTLNVNSTKDIAVDVWGFDIHEAAASLTINATGKQIGINTKTYVEIAKGTVNSNGAKFGINSGSYYVIEKGGKLNARQNNKDVVGEAALKGASYIEVRDNSHLTTNTENAPYGIHAATYLSILRSSSVDSEGCETGIYAGSYFSVLDNSSIKAYGVREYGMYSEKSYASILRSSKVDTTGGKIGIRVYLYFSIVDNSSLLAQGCDDTIGNGAIAQMQYVSVLRNSQMKAQGGAIGVYAKSYISILTGSKLHGMGDIGIHSDEYIHTNGASSNIYGEGQSIGILAKGNGGDSIFADGSATMWGDAKANADSVGIRIYGRGQIAARTGATIQGNGMRTAIETVNGYVESSNATLKGVQYNIDSGFSAISGSKGVKGLINGRVIEEYLRADIKVSVGQTINLTSVYASLGNSMTSLSNYAWDVTPEFMTIDASGITANKEFARATIKGTRTQNVKGERVSLASGASHEVSITHISTQ